MKSYIEKKKAKKGFTLIELLAVIVILAILALIAIPIVISIIKDSRTSSNKRSVDSFGRAAASAMSNYMTKNDMADYSVLLDQIYSWDDFIRVLNIKYSGSKVRCNNICISPSGAIGVARCAVGKDASNALSSGNFVKDENGGVYLYSSGEPRDTGTYMSSYGTMSVWSVDTYRDTYTAVGSYYLDYSTDTSGTVGLQAKGMRCKWVN